MDVVISVLIILCCIVLVLAVLVQNPKGGGLASGFTGGSQVMGVRRTADFLEKASWTLAVLLFVLSIWATSRVKKSSNAGGADAVSTTKDAAGNFDKPNAPAGNTAAPFGNGNPAPAAKTPPPAGNATPPTK